MKILLTGGSGLLGCEFSRQAKIAGHEVVTFSGDVRDMEATRRIWWMGVGALAHFAAIGVKFTSPDRTWENCMGTNLVGTLNLLDSITLSKCAPAVFIPGSVRELETMDVPHLWRDPYVVSKIAVAQAIDEWAKGYRGRVIRPSIHRLGTETDVQNAVSEIIEQIQNARRDSA